MKAFDRPMTKEEEKQMLLRCSAGDKEARNILVEKNMRLVAHMAKKYASAKKEWVDEDLISIGTIGLIKAVDSYRCSRDVRFSTYAAKCIDNEILMSLRQDKKREREVSLNEPIGKDKEGNEISLKDVLCEGNSLEEKDVVDNIMFLSQMRCIYDNIDKVLTPKERCILVKRYGLSGERECTQSDLADMLGISRSYVSRIEKKALEKLLALLEEKHLK